MRKRAVLAVVAVIIIAAALIAIFVLRQRPRRHRVVPAARPVEAPPAIKGIPPIEQWTATFSALQARGEWDDLDELLDEIAAKQRDQYERFSLAYLHARVLIERNEPKKAAEKLAPYLAPGNALRDLALYHQSEIEDARDEPEAASRLRQELVFGAPGSPYREQAIDEETEYLTSKSAAVLSAFATRLNPGASTSRRRELEAHLVEALVRQGDANGAVQKGLALLRAGTMDDPSDRVSRLLDKPELTRRMNADQLAMLGDSMRNHRHFPRAVALLSAALNGLPAKRDDLLFAIGRSYFGDEKYAEAQQTYSRGAGGATTPKAKATFLFHASRAAQLRGDDRVAEQLMTAARAVPGRFPATTAALTQRMRTRLKQKRVAEASADLQLLRKLAPSDHAIVDGAIAYATSMVAGGNANAAIQALNAIPPKLATKYDRPEIDYWRARAAELKNEPTAFAGYLPVLRARVPTHFAYFARQRLDAPALAPKVEREIQLRDSEAARLMATRNFAAAKEMATDAILLSARGRGPRLQRLATIYREIPAYRAILDLKPAAFPALPNAGPDRTSLLMALGLFDEAAEDVPTRWPLRPASSGLTQSLALNRGAASRESIYAIEVLMNSVPADFVPDLLPLTVRQLLYPRYFNDYIIEDSTKFGADPMLVLSIMREESRFNPRAKSEAAARGLLQFIIVTANEIGREIGIVDVDPEDLYDPRVIIRLGAKYIATLTKQFGGNHYMAAAAYNAGPKQVALWSRLAPAAGDDFFLSAVNFDETKDYVRKVMNSYKRYSEIYGSAGPQGGLRAEP